MTLNSNQPMGWKFTVRFLLLQMMCNIMLYLHCCVHWHWLLQLLLAQWYGCKHDITHFKSVS